MGKRKSPAFSFYPDSWLAGTSLMSRAEKGLYIDILAQIWLHGCLTREQIMRACFVVPGSADEACLDQLLSEKFVCEGGKYTNTRLEEERAKQRARATSGSKGGSKTQAKRQAKLDTAASKTASKRPSKSKGTVSDSVSDSVSVLDSDSGSTKKPCAGARSSSLGDDVIFPVAIDQPECVETWGEYVAMLERVHQIQPDPISLQEKLRQLSEASERLSAEHGKSPAQHAAAILRLSLADGWKKLILDGSHLNLLGLKEASRSGRRSAEEIASELAEDFGLADVRMSAGLLGD